MSFLIVVFILNFADAVKRYLEGLGRISAARGWPKAILSPRLNADDERRSIVRASYG